MLTGSIQVFFISMLPGLGKSTICDESHKFGYYNMFDLEDLIKQKKPFYKEFLTFNNRMLGYKDLMTSNDEKQRLQDIKNILRIIVDYSNKTKNDKIYIFSSIWWEHIGFCSTDIFISMSADIYNGKNLAIRGRDDLTAKFSDNILSDWANGYNNPSRNNTALEGSFVSTQLADGEFLSLDKLRALVNELFLKNKPIVQATHTIDYNRA